MRRFVMGALLAGLALPGMAVGQEQRGPLLEITTFAPDPAEFAAFEAGARKVVQAAREANLGDTWWHFWLDGFRYTLVFPVPNMAYFDDPQQFMRRFAGTPGEATLQQAFADLEQVALRIPTTEVIEAVPGWAYEPAHAPQTFSHAQFNEFWVKPGKQQEFEALVREFYAFFGEAGYPYRVLGHRVHFGATGRTIFVTFIDDLSAYYGRNSVERLAQQKGLMPRWQRLIARLGALVDASRDSNADFRPDLSYESPSGR